VCYIDQTQWPPQFVLFLFEKGKPVEKQGRKVSGLRGKTYDSGAAGMIWLLLWMS
jgi:hypothetical protein